MRSPEYETALLIVLDALWGASADEITALVQPVTAREAEAGMTVLMEAIRRAF